MNLRNWRNWGTNLMIRLGFKDLYAHAFVEQDYYVKDTTEEVSLAPTFLEFKIGRNWYNPFKWGVDDRPRGQPSPVDLEKVKREAVAEAAKAAKLVQQKNEAAMAKRDSEIKALKDAETQRLQQRQAKLTSSASALKIGDPRDTTGARRKKKERAFGTAKTRKDLTKPPTTINPAAGTGTGGTYSGVPVL